jgi:ATP-binding cassette subfamily C protein CydD
MEKAALTISESSNQRAFDQSKSHDSQYTEWLTTLAKTVRKPVYLAALAGIVQGLCVIIQAAILAGLLYQLIIKQIPLQSLLTVLLLLVLVIIFRSLSNYYAQLFGFQAGAQIKQQVRQAIFEKINVLGPAFSRQKHSGEIATIAIEQVEALQSYFSRYLPQLLLVKILPLVMIVVVMLVNWVVGLILLMTGPLIPVFMVLVGMGATAAHRNQFLIMSRMGGYFLDRIQGLVTLKLFGYEQHEVENIAEVAESFREHTMRVLKIAFLSSAVLEFFSAVAVALVAVYVGLGLLGLISFGPVENITLDKALFVLFLAPEFFLPLRQLAVHYHDKAAAIGAADAILKILHTEQIAANVTEHTPFVSSALIAMQQVCKRYDRDHVLFGIDLQIYQGEKIALVGSSGAGKTTLFNLLLGFETVTSGSVFLAGTPVTRTHATKQISWLGQSTYVFYASIKDNIALFNANVTDQQIQIAAEMAGVTAFTQEFEQGLNTLVGERGYGLSGGQVQRIALARAFLKQAPILMLDEPTANLDAGNSQRLLDDIERLFEDKTIIIATHDENVIQRMQRKITLQQGRIVP